jgi:hypothetical protein
LLEYVGAGDYDIHLLEPGVLYRDCWPVGPTGTSTVAPDKERKRE